MDKEILFLSGTQNVENLSPFMKYEYSVIPDQATAGNYSSNQCVFETITLSNNGKWADYNHGAYFTIPCVFVVSGKVGANNIIWTNDHIKDSDLLIGFKNSNLNLINSIAIDYGNKQCVQATDFINQYLIFKQHETFGEEDEILNGSTIGYAKDSSESYRFKDVANQGLFNNFNGDEISSSLENCKITNSGMRKRQEVFRRVSEDTSQQSMLLGSTTEKVITNLKEAGENFVVNKGTHKEYHYNAIIRLKDLPIFNKTGLMKGANWRITMTLNQCIFEVKKSAGGQLTFEQSSFTGRNTNFLMVSEKDRGVKAPNDGTDLESILIVNNGGSYTVPNSSTLTISCSVAKCNYSTHSALNVIHQNQNVRLHVPTVILRPGEDNALLLQKEKTIIYDDVLFFHLSGKKNDFGELITNGLSNLKRMIVCPILSQDANKGISPHISPFTTEPSTCSPYKIQNFQVKLASTNIYPEAINYSYDSFLTELNGKYSMGHNLAKGIAGSRISLKDYINTYGYIVVDLKRKHTPDESSPLALYMSGKIVSPLALDFFVFVETEKSFTYDVATGQRKD